MAHAHRVGGVQRGSLESAWSLCLYLSEIARLLKKGLGDEVGS